MRQKLTTGYSERLQRALAKGPRPMSIRQLGSEMKKAYPDLRGATYGGVRQYVAGNIQNPRIELLRAIAEVLQVRPEWLAFGEGEMTEKAQRVAEAAQQAAAPALSQIPGATNAPLDDFAGAALTATWKTLSGRYSRDELSEKVEEGEGPVTVSEPIPFTLYLYARLHHAVLQPLAFLGLDIERGDALNDYASAVAVAIRQYARTTQTTKGGTDAEA